jgi:hypothetical protein
VCADISLCCVDEQTPLHGFSMCIESLVEDSFSKLPEGKTKDHFIQTLEMCKTDCSFMTIAINRTMDFAKSTSNIRMCCCRCRCCRCCCNFMLYFISWCIRVILFLLTATNWPTSIVLNVCVFLLFFP